MTTDFMTAQLRYIQNTLEEIEDGTIIDGYTLGKCLIYLEQMLEALHEGSQNE